MEESKDYTRYKTVFLLLTAVIFIWGVVGTLDITRIPYAGYILSPDSVVTQAREGSPAAMAGLKVGDSVTQIDGIAVENSAGFAGQARPAINSEGSITPPSAFSVCCSRRRCSTILTSHRRSRDAL